MRWCMTMMMVYVILFNAECWLLHPLLPNSNPSLPACLLQLQHQANLINKILMFA